MSKDDTNQLAQAVIDKAIETGSILATAESCTGGMIAAALTDIAGSSAAFDRGFVTYSNEAKADLLGVPIEHTQNPGAVSSLVAEEMALGAIARSKANFSVAVTGIAGPDGGSELKPVGLVYIALGSDQNQVDVRECRFGESHGATTRADIRTLTVQTALTMLINAMS